LVEIRGEKLNTSEIFKKSQAFPFFGPSPGREGNDSLGERGKRRTTVRGREGKRGRKKPGERYLFPAWTTPLYISSILKNELYVLKKSNGFYGEYSTIFLIDNFLLLVARQNFAE
jgi:hypothetical protein